VGLGLAPGLLESELLPQQFGLPAFSQVYGQSHPIEESIQVFFPHLDSTKCRIPLAPLAQAGRGLYILYHRIRER